MPDVSTVQTDRCLKIRLYLDERLAAVMGEIERKCWKGADSYSAAEKEVALPALRRTDASSVASECADWGSSARIRKYKVRLFRSRWSEKKIAVGHRSHRIGSRSAIAPPVVS